MSATSAAASSTVVDRTATRTRYERELFSLRRTLELHRGSMAGNPRSTRVPLQATIAAAEQLQGSSEKQPFHERHPIAFAEIERKIIVGIQRNEDAEKIIGTVRDLLAKFNIQLLL